MYILWLLPVAIINGAIGSRRKVAENSPKLFVIVNYDFSLPIAQFTRPTNL
jgi:hypothetical protein